MCVRIRWYIFIWAVWEAEFYFSIFKTFKIKTFILKFRVIIALCLRYKFWAYQISKEKVVGLVTEFMNLSIFLKVQSNVRKNVLFTSSFCSYANKDIFHFSNGHEAVTCACTYESGYTIREPYALMFVYYSRTDTAHSC